MPSVPTQTAIATLVQIVERDGVRAGVRYLTSLTVHRFTALYRFDREALRNLYFFDREHPTVESTTTIPVVSSFSSMCSNRERRFAQTIRPGTRA